ncbi:MAG: Serine 3-dehydrogenase [Crocinitomicaceae bacterium]|jgi:NADP-dependent 3-hydroxy acid dehydrogenase YdfG|nr:Serine 3-dehydrogenase [Crocinitomicaceae bacterium]
MEKENRYILISGATSGFGYYTARIFAQNGWNLVLTGRRNDRLEEAKRELSSTYSCEIETLCFDVRNNEEVERSIASLPQEILQNIRILVNNAGLALGRNSIDNGDINDWEQMIDTNLKGLLYLSRQIIPLFKANKAGHIVNISSIAGKEVYPDGNVYCASKHGVDALSKAMRMDLLPYNIKVTNIAPGAANTEFSLVRFKGSQETADAVYNGFEPLVAQDIAETIYFACTRPAHVVINDLTIMPAAQASATVFHKIKNNK